MSEEKAPEKLPSLTHLTTQLGMLANALAQHTDGRNYLSRALREPCSHVPVIVIGEQQVDPEDPDNKVVRPAMSALLGDALDGDMRELLLTSLIEHKQADALRCWESIFKVADEAKRVIEVMRGDAKK